MQISLIYWVVGLQIFILGFLSSLIPKHERLPQSPVSDINVPSALITGNLFIHFFHFHADFLLLKGLKVLYIQLKYIEI